MEVLASDPAAKPDLMNWAKRTGNEVVSVEDKEGYVRILIKRLK
ncbi:MAG: sulfurtransferase TusA family protein [Sulfolobaceae archaeon]|nr:sulfurtransferase TusA family protein [Sulfolobaceae archaeon]MCY0859912.1 sulfurtransferase TusA family protein [Sulfolobaceae archaeon]